MKKTLAVIATLALTTPLAACGGSAESDPEVNRVNVEEIYYQSLASSGVSATKQQMIDAGEAVCMVLDEGYTPSDIFMAMHETNEVLAPGIDEYEMPLIVGGAVAAFCPEYGRYFE